MNLMIVSHVYNIKYFQLSLEIFKKYNLYLLKSLHEYLASTVPLPFSQNPSPGEVESAK